jgi:phosphatidate cytidylyltransferase
MALDVKTLRVRALSALIFVVIMLAGILTNHISFFVLFTGIYFGCWYEYDRLLLKMRYRYYSRLSQFFRYGLAFFGFGFMLYQLSPILIFETSLREVGLFLLSAFGIALPTSLVFSEKKKWQDIRNITLGLLYLSVSMALLFRLYLAFIDLPNPGFFLLCLLIGTIWINDTMAYLVGSLIGKTPLSAISPKKTWEGTVGGALLAVVIMSLLMHYYFPAITMVKIIPLLAIITVTGTLGDLLESKLKRMAKVKDSGQILPGHGGFLDRFDSLLVAVPFTWLYVHFIW